MDKKEIDCPCFPCIWKTCKGTFTQVSGCCAVAPSGVQTRVVTCESCLCSYEIKWTPDRPKVRVPVVLHPPWSAEGKRRLKALGLWDPADPRCYQDGIVPAARKRRSGTPRPQ